MYSFLFLAFFCVYYCEIEKQFRYFLCAFYHTIFMAPPLFVSHSCPPFSRLFCFSSLCSALFPNVCSNTEVFFFLPLLLQCWPHSEGPSSMAFRWKLETRCRSWRNVKVRCKRCTLTVCSIPVRSSSVWMIFLSFSWFCFHTPPQWMWNKTIKTWFNCSFQF